MPDKDLPKVVIVRHMSVDEDGEEHSDFDAACPVCGAWQSALPYAVALAQEGNDLCWPSIQCYNCKTEFRTRRASADKLYLDCEGC